MRTVALSLQPGFADEGQGLLPLWLTLISFGGEVYVYLHSPSYPFLDALRGLHSEAAVGRIDFRTSFSGNVYIRNLVSYGVGPLICYYMYSLYRMRRTKHLALYFVFNLLIMGFLFTFNAQKAWIINYLVGLIIMKVTIDGKLNRATLALFVMGGLVFVLLMYGIVGGVDIRRQLRLDSAMVQRVLVGNVESVFASLELFPDHISNEDLYLVGIPSPILRAFGKDVTPSKRLLMEYLRPDAVQEGRAGYAVDVYLARHGPIMGMLVCYWHP